MARPASIRICDDEPSLRELLRVSLGPDYTFYEAADGAEAIEVAERVRPDLVLLDVMMPGRSGLDVVAHIRTTPELATTPIVIISAFSSGADRIAALELGATAFLAKPFDPDELSALVEELLALRV